MPVLMQPDTRKLLRTGLLLFGTGVTTSYKWMIDGKLVWGAGTYQVKPEDAGKQIDLVVTGSKAGYLPFSQTVEVAAGGTATVDVKLVRRETPSSVRRPIGIAIAGVGAAGLVVGAVTGILAIFGMLLRTGVPGRLRR